MKVFLNAKITDPKYLCCYIPTNLPRLCMLLYQVSNDCSRLSTQKYCYIHVVEFPSENRTIKPISAGKKS